jgi:DNA-binding transcriptional MocR family regulator
VKPYHRGKCLCRARDRGIDLFQDGERHLCPAANPLLTLPKDDPGAPWPLWQQNVELQVKPTKTNPSEETTRKTAHPHPISLASGIGDAHLFPAEDFRKVLQTVMRRDGIARSITESKWTCSSA